MRKRLAENGVRNAERLTMAQMLAKYLRESGRQQSDTLAWYTSLVRPHINPVVGKVLLRDFRAEHARKVLNAAAKRIAPKSVIAVRNTMRAAHSWILAEGFDGRRLDWRNQVPPPYVRRAKDAADIPTADEVRRVLAHVRGTEHEAIVSVLIDGGFRRGELLALHWKDVDLNAARSPSRALSAARTGTRSSLVGPEVVWSDRARTKRARRRCISPP